MGGGGGCTPLVQYSISVIVSITTSASISISTSTSTSTSTNTSTIIISSCISTTRSVGIGIAYFMWQAIKLEAALSWVGYLLRVVVCRILRQCMLHSM